MVMEIAKHIVDLVENSVEALSKHVLILLTEEESGIALEVSDDGVGVSEEEVRKAFLGEKAPRGRGLSLLKETAEGSGGSFTYASTGRGTVMRALFGEVPVGRVGDALILFWQEMPIMVVTLSIITKKGSYVFDSRLIGEKYGDPSSTETMVKVRGEINLAVTNLFGGK